MELGITLAGLGLGMAFMIVGLGVYTLLITKAEKIRREER